ncbi:MAG: 16S rRNA processing protein RimM [Clostridia bacterium]|nr:16S rRNA processing protein RimM [Clostridia bacterium]
MKKEFIEAGEIVGTHGVRGMVRIKPWADSGEFLSGFKTLYSGDKKTPLRFETIKPHGNIVIAAVCGVDSIEKAETLRGKVLYIKREDADIPEGRYFVSELIGCRVFDSETKAEYGVIADVSATGANDVWHIKKDGKEYLLPAINEVVKRVDIEREEIEICPMKGIFDDEN